MNDFVELRRYIIVILRRWWVFVLAASIAAALGYTITQRQPRTYQATATIMVGQPIQATNLSDLDFKTGEQLAQTYAEIALRQPVLQAVVTALELNDSWQTLRKQVGIDTVPGTQLIEVSASANSPEEAASIADEVARQLILLSPTSSQNQENDEDQRFVRQRLEHLRERLRNGESRLNDLDQELADPTLSYQEVQTLLNEINLLETLIASWENNFAQLLLLTDNKNSPNYLTVIEPAQVNFGATRPNTVLNTLMAMMIGLMLALGIIVLLEYLDDRIKSTDDLSQVVGLTPLGTIGQIKGKAKLVTLLEPFSSVAESYRMIRSNIQLGTEDEPRKAIMVTSAIGGEGKSTAAANLGVVMAQAGFSTIIVDMDLRRPIQHEFFEVPLKGGVTDLLRCPELEPGEYLKDTPLARLRLLTSGELPRNPSELFSSQRMGQLLISLKEEADIIILDSPPATLVADGVELSRRVDGVLLVVEANRARRDVVKQAVLNLQQAGGNLLGVVLNKKPGLRVRKNITSRILPSFLARVRELILLRILRRSWRSHYAPRLPSLGGLLQWTGTHANGLQQLQPAESSWNNLQGNRSSENGREKKNVFTLINSRGQTYFLHKRQTSPNNGRNQSLYFFAREIKDHPLAEFPSGYEIYEGRNGLPFLKKAD